MTQSNLFGKWLPVSIFTVLMMLALIVFPSGKAYANQSIELTSGTFTINLSKSKMRESENSVTYRYHASLIDATNSLLGGATLSFEGYANGSTQNFMIKAKEIQQGVYEAELTLAKNTDWSITVLGRHESYPYRMNFTENTSIIDRPTGSTGPEDTASNPTFRSIGSAKPGNDLGFKLTVAGLAALGCLALFGLMLLAKKVRD